MVLIVKRINQTISQFRGKIDTTPQSMGDVNFFLKSTTQCWWATRKNATVGHKYPALPLPFSFVLPCRSLQSSSSSQSRAAGLTTGDGTRRPGPPLLPHWFSLRRPRQNPLHQPGGQQLLEIWPGCLDSSLRSSVSKPQHGSFRSSRPPICLLRPCFRYSVSKPYCFVSFSEISHFSAAVMCSFLGG